MSAKQDSFLIIYKTYKENRSSIPSKQDLLLEILKVYYDSTNKKDKKQLAKLVLKSKDRLQEYDFWCYIDEHELENRLKYSALKEGCI